MTFEKVGPDTWVAGVYRVWRNPQKKFVVLAHCDVVGTCGTLKAAKQYCVDNPVENR